MPRLSFLLFFSLFIFSCSNEPSQKIIQGEIYGTTWQLKYFSEENDVSIKAIVVNELNRIDKLFSHYRDDSLTTLINKNKIAYKDVAEEWKKLDQLGWYVHKQSNGYFNHKVLGYYDFNSFAKGYAVDKVSNILKANNINDFVIEIGGELRFEGFNNSKPWAFAIEDPSLAEIIHKRFSVLRNLSIASSGNYRNPGHILDPNTSEPSKTNLLSVTVIDEDSTTLADAWATALYASQKDDWLKLADKNNLNAYFIYGENEKVKIISTSNWSELVE
jgi:thiamine biosynthesis lipoprotein ApbE